MRMMGPYSIQTIVRRGINLQNDSMMRYVWCLRNRSRKHSSSMVCPISSPPRRSILRSVQFTAGSRGTSVLTVGPRFSISTAKRAFSFGDVEGDDEHWAKPLTEAEIKFREATTDLILGDDDKNSYPIGTISPDFILDVESALLSWANERSATGFDFSLKLLTRLVQEHEAQGQLPVEPANISQREPDTRSVQPYFVRRFLVSRVVDCWRICWRSGVVHMEPSAVFALLEEWKTRGVQIDNRAWTMIIDGMLTRGDAFEAPLLSQWVLDQRMEEAEHNPSLRPDSFLLTSVIRAWAKSGRIEAPEMAEGILDLMHSLYKNGWENSGPNLVSYLATMDAWSRSRRPESTMAMDRLLNQLKESTTPGLEPDSSIYAHVIETWARSRGPSGVQNARKYLQEMIELYESGNDMVVPHSSIFARVIYALAKQGDAQGAEDEYMRLKSLYDESWDPQFKPDEECKKALLAALSRKGSSAKAKYILDEMIDAAVAGDQCMIKRSYFINLLVALTKESNPVTAAEESDQLIRRMVDLARAKFPDLMPDSLTFLKVAQAWSRVRDGKGVEKIESLLRLMKNLRTSTGSSALQPTAKFMEVLVLTLCRSSHPEALRRAETLICEMEQAFSAGDSGMMPSRGIYTNLMQALVRSDEPNHHAVQEIFDKLNILYSQGQKDCRPDVMVYSALMDSFAQRGDAVKVQAIFERMIDEYNHGYEAAKPDMQAFNMIIKAWSFSEQPNRGQNAESALGKLDEFANAVGLSLRPDAYTFVHMIRTWCDSDSEDSAKRAHHYLRNMIEMGFEPSFSIYFNVLRRLLKTGDKQCTLVAAGLVEELVAAVESKRVALPHPRAYRHFLETVGRSSIPGMNQQAQNLLSTLKEGKVPRTLMPSAQR